MAYFRPRRRVCSTTQTHTPCFDDKRDRSTLRGVGSAFLPCHLSRGIRRRLTITGIQQQQEDQPCVSVPGAGPIAPTAVKDANGNPVSKLNQNMTPQDQMLVPASVPPSFYVSNAQTLSPLCLREFGRGGSLNALTVGGTALFHLAVRQPLGYFHGLWRRSVVPKLHLTTSLMQVGDISCPAAESAE